MTTTSWKEVCLQRQRQRLGPIGPKWENNFSKKYFKTSFVTVDGVYGNTMVAENWQSIEEWVSSESSVTKLGEIYHFGEILLHFGSFEKVRLLFGNILNLLWHILSGFSANVQCGKWPNIESINWSSGHTEWEKERGMCVCDRCRESNGGIKFQK